MGYINSKGEYFENIRNIKFKDERPLLFGNFYTQNKKQGSSLTFSDMDDCDGVYIYKSYYDEKTALRIYKDFLIYKYIHHDDEEIVSKLQKRQKNIKLTQFPTGVVTLENVIIGQEIPLYENHQDIIDCFKDKVLIKKPTHYYTEILKILRELYNNGIVYSDVHGRNFLVSNIDNTIKLIDFEKYRISFDDDNKYYYPTMINNLKSMFYDLNAFYNIEFSDDFKKAKTLEEIDECVKEKHLELAKGQY